MPVQQQMSNLAAKMGGRLSAAVAMHADAPINTGIQRLPGGIKGGVAKLQVMECKDQTEDGKGTPKGATYFRAAAVALWPKEHDGQRVEKLQTSLFIPLCDIPPKPPAKGSTFEENLFTFQNLFKLLSNGALVCRETQQTDPSGTKAWAFFQAAMKTLTDPRQPPVYVEFSTRSWKGPKKINESDEEFKNREPMVFETWHGLATAEAVSQATAQLMPGAGMVDNTNGQVHAPNVRATQPDMHSAPPVPEFNEFASGMQELEQDITDEVASLVETAMDDPECATAEGQAATQRLEELAWAAGWSKEQTAGAANWEAVGDMALNAPEAAVTSVAATAPPAAPTAPQASVPVVGGKHRFAKRTNAGGKLKNNKGEEFPALEVEVVTVNAADKTCTVKYAKDGKDVVDIRSKQPVAVKWEWLE